MVTYCPLCDERFQGNPVDKKAREELMAHYMKHNWLRRTLFEWFGIK